MRRPWTSVTSAIVGDSGMPIPHRAVLAAALVLLVNAGSVAGQSTSSSRTSGEVQVGMATGSNHVGWHRAELALPPLHPVPIAFGDPRVTEPARVAFLLLLDPLRAAQDDVTPARPGAALLASAVLPGTGQFMQGNDRWVPYLAIELWSWISFFKRRSDAHDLAAGYRDLAWSVARRVSIGERRDTIFEYYEEMTHYASSGTFDSDPEAIGIQPEFDARTFNGDLWALSRGLYWGGQTYLPGTSPYNQALNYYLDHAIPATFTWAWGDSFLEQQSFRELIRRSDDAYRTSTQFLGLLLANHIVSAVDALVIGRLRGARGESRLRVGSGFEPTAGRVPRLRIEAIWRW